MTARDTLLLVWPLSSQNLTGQVGVRALLKLPDAFSNNSRLVLASKYMQDISWRTVRNSTRTLPCLHEWGLSPEIRDPAYSGTISPTSPHLRFVFKIPDYAGG